MLYVNDISINLEKCITHNQLIVQRHLKCSLPTSTPLFCLASIPTSEAWGAGGIETKSHMIRHVWALAWSQRSGGQWWSNDKSPCETAASFIWSHSFSKSSLCFTCGAPRQSRLPRPFPKSPGGQCAGAGGWGWKTRIYWAPTALPASMPLEEESTGHRPCFCSGCDASPGTLSGNC